MQMEDPVPSGPGCGWPERAQTGAPPTPPLAQGLYQQRRRACAPSADPTMRHDRRASSVTGQQTRRTPTAGRPCIMTGTGRSGGTLSPGRPGLCPCQPEAECARGPRQERPRPQEQGREALRDRAHHQPRSAFRGAAGCPRLKGWPETK
jgi:hypothetical protein